jgi:hypothetical protein
MELRPAQSFVLKKKKKAAEKEVALLLRVIEY